MDAGPAYRRLATAIAPPDEMPLQQKALPIFPLAESTPLLYLPRFETVGIALPWGKECRFLLYMVTT